MASKPSDKAPEARIAKESLERVRRNVLRTIVDELRRELDSIDEGLIHAKADTHKKFDYYLKGLPT